MTYDRAKFVQLVRRFAVVLVAAGVAGLLSGGCPALGPDNQPKEITVRFRTFDVGTNDCEDIFSFGDFRVAMSVDVELDETRRVTSKIRNAELGSAAFQTTVQSVDFDETIAFTLQPGKEFEIGISVTEDDPNDADEPQPWIDTEIFNFLTVSSRSITFTNGPGCFSDDRFEVTVTVAE
ncbi:MAG: hypothetical protein AB7N71_12010 [Phycisphaerae bacterium]